MDSDEFDRTAGMLIDGEHNALFAKFKDYVKQTIRGLNIPEEIQNIVDKRIMEIISSLLERNVPPIVEGMVNAKIGWYKETMESQSVEIHQLKKRLAEETSKRRKVSREHRDTVARLEDMEVRLKALEPDMPNSNSKLLTGKKSSLFSWKRSDKEDAISHQ